MKIIGERDGGFSKVFIVEASATELCNLQNLYGHHRAMSDLHAGVEINVSEAFSHLRNLQDAKIVDLAKQLRTVSEWLEAQDPVVKALTADEPKKEESGF